jgi:hypothetical protein
VSREAQRAEDARELERRGYAPPLLRLMGGFAHFAQ